jgi:hypothetical protein
MQVLKQKLQEIEGCKSQGINHDELGKENQNGKMKLEK